MCAKASTSASRNDWSNSRPAVFEVAELPRNGIARTGITSIIAAITSRLSDQPKWSINPFEIGANKNIPSEPDAVPRPKASERFSALTSRASAARMTPKEQAATPIPTSTPAPICNQTGASASAIIIRPATYITAPSARTRQVPYRSDTAPMNG